VVETTGKPSRAGCVQACGTGSTSASNVPATMSFVTARTTLSGYQASPICLRIARASAVSGRSSSATIEK